MRRLAFLAAASLAFTAISSSPSAFANPHNFEEAVRKCDEACDYEYECMQCCCEHTRGGGRSCTNPHSRHKQCTGKDTW